MPIQTQVSYRSSLDEFEDYASTTVSVESATQANARTALLRIGLVLEEILSTRTAPTDSLDPLAVPAAPFQAPKPIDKVGVRSEQMERCIADIRRWLGVGLNGVSAALGINRGTIYASRKRRSEVRPATFSRVIRSHALVSAAVAAVGEERARGWFHAGNPSPWHQLTAARGDSAIQTELGRRIRRELVAVPVPPPNKALAATADDLYVRRIPASP